MEERLQKIIARAGIASRRNAEELISSGQVAVNGRVVTELGTKADAGRDHIRVAGKLLRPVGAKVYIALNKPDGVVATMRDPEGRRTIADFVRGVPGRVFPVGRLEYHASGLLLLTNDGELANRVMRAHALPQIYLCKTSGTPSESEIRDAERAGRAKMERAKGLPGGWWQVTLSGATKDQFRQALMASGHAVDKMKRIAIGYLEMGPLAPGQYRHLTNEEVSELERALARAERHADASKETESGRRSAPRAKSRSFHARKRSQSAKERFPRR